MAADRVCFWAKYCKLVTVEPTLFLYMFGHYLHFPAFQALVYKKTCLDYYNESFCSEMDNKTFQSLHKEEQDIVQTYASYWTMVSNIGLTLPAIVVVFFFLGSWGDKVNRKLPILLPCVGTFIYNIFNILNAIYMDWSPGYLMIATVFNGFLGGTITMMMGVYSYITHVSSAEEKTTRVGIVESMMFLAGTLGVFVSGPALEVVGYMGVFGIACGCKAVAFLYSLLWLESIKPPCAGDNRKSCCEIWFLDSLKDMFLCVKRSRSGKSKTHLVLMVVVLNIVMMCTAGETDILYLFLKRSPRSFTTSQFGYFKGSENFTRGLALVTILPFLKHVLNLRDTTILMVGLVSKAIGLVMLGFADSMALVFSVVIFLMFQGFPAAALRSGMSSLVEKDEQGRMFAIVAASESCIILATTFIFNGWYPTTLDTFDGTCFEFAAGMCGLALIISIYLHISIDRELKGGELKSETYETVEGNIHTTAESNGTVEGTISSVPGSEKMESKETSIP